MYFRIKRLIVIRFNSLWKRYDILYSTFANKEKRRFDECVKQTRDFNNQIIINRRKQLLESKDKDVETKETDLDDSRIGRSKKMAFLDMLLQATINGRPLTNEEIIEEVDTFMFAVGQLFFYYIIQFGNVLAIFYI